MRASRRFAYYASLNGNRSNYGLQTPIGQVFHDAENGYGGFASFIYNPSAENQFRLVTSLRQDYYQIPYDPDPNSIGNQQLVAVGAAPSYGLRDGEHETDSYVAFSWVHTFNPNLLLTVSPFYHYTKASYQASPNDYPVATNVDQSSNYGGLQASLNANVWKNDIQAGVYGFAQHQSNYFNNQFTDGSQNFPPSSASITGGLEEVETSYSNRRFPVRRATQMGTTRINHEQTIRIPVNPDTVFLEPLLVNSQAVVRGISDFENSSWFKQYAWKEEPKKCNEPACEEKLRHSSRRSGVVDG